MPSGGPRTVLLVDDDDLVRESTAICLKREGFKLIEVSSAAEALRTYEEKRGQIDLVVTDLIMPELSGDQLALRLWQQNPALPILFVSGNTPENIATGVKLDRDHNFLQKPFCLTNLVELIRKSLGTSPPAGSRG